MLFVIGFILSMIFLEWPARLFVVVPLALIELGEIALWLRWRNVRSTTGVEALVGTKATVTTDCDPDGQVRVKGQLWRAHSDQPVRAGDQVIVTQVDGLQLEVAPLVSPGAPSSSGRAPDF